MSKGEAVENLSEPDLIEKVLQRAMKQVQSNVAEVDDSPISMPATKERCLRELTEAQAALAAYQKVKALLENWNHEFCVTCGRDLASKSGLGCCQGRESCRRCDIHGALRGEGGS